MSQRTMQAARIADYGGPEQVVVEQVSLPEPGEGQVLVRLKAAGVNPADWKMVAGLFKKYMALPFPWIPGLEGAGTIEAVGPGVTTLAPGQAVYGPFSSSYAEYVVAPASDAFLKPKLLSFNGAASVPIGALTAWQAVVEEARVQPGQHILVHGGAGGVGLFAVQLAKCRGARVTATASAANANFVRSLGAETVIDYQTTRFEDVVKNMDAVVDTVGGELPTRSLGVIKPGGVLVTVAGMVDPEEGLARGIRATSSRRGDVSLLAQISDLIQSKQITPHVGPVFSLAAVRQALEQSRTGHGRGRIVLHIAD